MSSTGAGGGDSDKQRRRRIGRPGDRLAVPVCHAARHTGQRGVPHRRLLERCWGGQRALQQPRCHTGGVGSSGGSRAGRSRWRRRRQHWRVGRVGGAARRPRQQPGRQRDSQPSANARSAWPPEFYCLGHAAGQPASQPAGQLPGSYRAGWQFTSSAFACAHQPARGRGSRSSDARSVCRGDAGVQPPCSTSTSSGHIRVRARLAPCPAPWPRLWP